MAARPARRQERHRGVALGFVLGLGVAGAMACSTTTKKEVAKSALDSMTQPQRLDDFEATCRALDERPEMVDEFYSKARVHGPLMDRFLMNAAKDLADESFAKLTAKHLVENPASLEQVLVQTMDAIAPLPPARAAMNRAMISRAEEATEIMGGDPATMSRVVEASLVVLEKRPQARKAVVIATQKNRARILAFIKEDPALMKQVGEQVLREAVKDKPALEKALRLAKVIEDQPQ